MHFRASGSELHQGFRIRDEGWGFADVCGRGLQKAKPVSVGFNVEFDRVRQAMARRSQSRGKSPPSERRPQDWEDRRVFLLVQGPGLHVFGRDLRHLHWHCANGAPKRTGSGSSLQKGMRWPVHQRRLQKHQTRLQRLAEVATRLKASCPGHGGHGLSGRRRPHKKASGTGAAWRNIALRGLARRP